MAGYMYDWQKTDINVDDDIGEKDFDGDVDWETPFGEGAGLVTCGGFNAQVDIAYYSHSTDVDLSDLSPGIGDKDEDQTNTHIGGALFYRDPSAWALGLEGSWISQSVFGKDVDIFRVGAFGEFYLGDTFTLGASAHYYDTDDDNLGALGGKDEDGFELAAWGRFYATPDLSLMLRGDLLFADTSLELGLGGPATEVEGDLDGWAITGEAEYLVWDQGLSIFGGARYAERTLDLDLPEPAPGIEFDVDDFQVFAGIKFYFGHDGTLVERQRTGTVDNTSVWNEKLPNFTASTFAGIIDAADGAAP